MRVIDADKIIDKILVNCPFEIDKQQYESIWGVPIIEAIPIEWIRKWEEENWELECNYGIDDMIDDWRKENEQKN